MWELERDLEAEPSAQVTICSHTEKIIRWLIQHGATNQTEPCASRRTRKEKEEMEGNEVNKYHENKGQRAF